MMLQETFRTGFLGLLNEFLTLANKFEEKSEAAKEEFLEGDEHVGVDS